MQIFIESLSYIYRNLYRMGRAGGRWRHITSCTASSGSHLAFVEGKFQNVKLSKHASEGNSDSNHAIVVMCFSVYLNCLSVL